MVVDYKLSSSHSVIAEIDNCAITMVDLGCQYLGIICISPFAELRSQGLATLNVGRPIGNPMCAPVLVGYTLSCLQFVFVEFCTCVDMVVELCGWWVGRVNFVA